MEIREMLGVSYFMLDDFVHSAEVLRPVADQLPDNPGLLYAAGVSLVRTGNPKEGGRMFSRMLEHSRNVPEIHLLLGQAYAEQSEYANALNEISRALELNPKLGEAHYYAGKVHFKQGRLDEAAQEYQAELTLNPRYVPAMYELAYVRLQQHQAEIAARLLKEIVSEKPDYADAYYQLGKAMLEQGDVKTAIQNLETSVRLQPSSYAYYQLSFAYRRDGRPEDAQHALEKYETLHKKQSPNKSQANN
jgi:tetratricopeptide (TPR) repeat protein